jgi:hypothetical protein
LDRNDKARKKSLKDEEEYIRVMMEMEAEYNEQRLHGSKHFVNLRDNIKDVPESVIQLFEVKPNWAWDVPREQQKLFCTSWQSAYQGTGGATDEHSGHPKLRDLLWVLEVGEAERFKA